MRGLRFAILAGLVFAVGFAVDRESHRWMAVWSGYRNDPDHWAWLASELASGFVVAFPIAFLETLAGRIAPSLGRDLGASAIAVILAMLGCLEVTAQVAYVRTVLLTRSMEAGLAAASAELHAFTWDDATWAWICGLPYALAVFARLRGWHLGRQLLFVPLVWGVLGYVAPVAFGYRAYTPFWVTEGILAFWIPSAFSIAALLEKRIERREVDDAA